MEQSEINEKLKRSKKKKNNTTKLTYVKSEICGRKIQYNEVLMLCLEKKIHKIMDN
jgi:hypothetical protein